MLVLSQPAKERFLMLLHLLEKHITAGKSGPVTSAQVEHLTGWTRDTIRKDISCLGMIAGKTGDETIGGSIGGNTGYDPATLIPLIKKALGLNRCRKFCVVGLGRLGSAYLNFKPPELGEFELAAGFDSNVNRVEILQSSAPLYPVYKLAEVIRRFGIEIALLCVPANAAQSVAEKCAAAGIRGILNFAPAALKLPPEVTVKYVFVTDSLRSVAINI